MNRKKHLKIGILSLQVQPVSGGRIQLFPTGQFRANDGRPEDCAHWVMNETVAQKLIAKMRTQKNDFVVDYEHQTFAAEKNGKEAPAAGWFKAEHAFYNDDGFFVDNVDWTPNAAEYLANKEYRYVSPVFFYDPRNGEIIELINAALTNNPALDGMEAAQLVAACRQALLTSNPTHTPEQNQMDKILEILRQLLGLPADATEEQILQALLAIQDSSADPDKSGAEAKMTLPAFITKLNKRIEALTVAAKVKTDGAHYSTETITALTSQIAELKAKVSGNELETLIQEGLKEGKLTADLEKWARDQGAKDIEPVRAFLKSAPAITALTSLQTENVKLPDGSEMSLTEEEKQVAKLTGLTAAEFAQAKREQQEA